MTLFFHELKRSRLSLIIWTAVLSFMMVICIVIYPEMKTQMANLGEMFSDMGEFSEAFSMDTLDIGDFVGFIAVECGEVLGLGGALFAGLCGIMALTGEQRDGTAEFLLTHPVSRTKVAGVKLASVIVRVIIMNTAVLAICTAATAMIGEISGSGVLIKVWLAYVVMQLEVAVITFGLSGVLKGRAIAAGLGVPFALYFVSIVSNIMDELEFLKFLTPFGYADGAAIASGADFEIKYLVTGVVIAVAVLILGFVRFNKKDIV